MHKGQIGGEYYVLVKVKRKKNLGRKKSLGLKTTLSLCRISKSFLQDKATNLETHLAEVMALRKTTLWVRADREIYMIHLRVSL